MILFNYYRGTEEKYKKSVNPSDNINVLFGIWYIQLPILLILYVCMYKHNKSCLAERDSDSG